MQGIWSVVLKIGIGVTNWFIYVMLEECEMIWIDEGVWVDKDFWEIREPLYTVVDHSKVEMLRYIPQSLFRVSEVSVMKVWCREIRQWWIPNRKEYVFFRSGRSFLQLGIQIWIVFQFIMWWLFSISNVFWMLWHCFFQGSGTLAGVSCLFSTPVYCSGCILDKDAVK